MPGGNTSNPGNKTNDYTRRNAWLIVPLPHNLTRLELPLKIAVQDKAEVAELADALGSGSSGLKLVGVRVPPSAPS
jgi:hypothetical protein